jgi:hypothetical protein
MSLDPQLTDFAKTWAEQKDVVKSLISMDHDRVDKPHAHGKTV